MQVWFLTHLQVPVGDVPLVEILCVCVCVCACVGVWVCMRVCVCVCVRVRVCVVLMGVIHFHVQLCCGRGGVHSH